jgi:hypothetical protein
VLVTCGPSLGLVDGPAFRGALSGVLTIVVKQAIDVVGDQADFLCWNPYNVRRFVVPSAHTVRCFVSEPSGRMIQHNRADLTFPAVRVDGDLDRSLAVRQDFEAHQLDRTVVRPFGPGIVYELCLYLAVHLGVQSILTVGWDIADSSGKNTHFDDRSGEQQFFESVRSDAMTPAGPSAGPRVPEFVRRPVRWVRTRKLHSGGAVYNRTRVLPGETEAVGASTRAAHRWLAERGVDLMVASDSPHLDQAIPRIPVDRVPALVQSWR